MGFDMHVELVNIIFYAFAGLTILAAFLAVIQRNPVRCVLFLVLTFFGSAGVWLLAHAEFLALILVLVYVGAVMTLFLFVEAIEFLDEIVVGLVTFVGHVEACARCSLPS